MTKEQESELLRLQAITTEKRKIFLELDNALREKGGSNGLLEKHQLAEADLTKASYNFNDFTGTLPLKKQAV